MEPNDGDGRLTIWFQKFRKPISSWLRNRAHVAPGEVDDLAQECYLRLLKYSEDTMVDNPQGYLFRVAANVANEWRERARVRRPHDSGWLDELLDAECRQPEAALGENQERALVSAAIERLPARQRQIVLLHLDGLTYKEIAQYEGLTYRIVLRDLTRAYGKLRMELMAQRSA